MPTLDLERGQTEREGLQPGETSGASQSSQGGCGEGGRECGDRAGGGGFKLREGRCGLAIRRKFCAVRVERH